MIASAPLQLAPILDADRDRLVYALAGTVIEPYALDCEDEIAVVSLAEHAILDVLKIADSLATKQIELSARRGRRARHLRGCKDCRSLRRCRTYQQILNDIDALTRRCADEAGRLRRAR